MKMKYICQILLLIFITCNLIYSQVTPSITYDQQSGNYIIEYFGYANYNSEEKENIRLIFEPSTKIDPRVRVIVNRTIPDQFQYAYILVNSLSSEQRLYDFHIDINSQITEIGKPDENWFTGSFKFQPIYHWYNSKGVLGVAHPLDGIAPDSSLSGFTYKSVGLPSVVKAYFQGNETTVLAFPDEPPMEIEELLKPLLKFPNNTVIRLTVGPKDPPDPFSSQSFIDTIKVYSQKSLDLNWIKDETIKNKYAGYLETAQNLGQTGEGTAAKVQLNNLLTDLESDSLQYLTNESYALLRFNTEYLISKIPDGTNVIINKLAGSVDYTIASSGGQVTYNYTVINSDTSSQSIANVYVQNNSGGTLTAPTDWQATAQTGFGLSGFTASLPAAEINASASLGNFSIVTTGLPAPGNVYLQSARSTVDSSDIFDNSFIAGAIVPTSPPEPFVALDFVDTLIAYNNLCLANGWYTQSWAHNVQKVALDNTRLMLTLNVPASSLIIMQQFLLTMDSYHNSGFLTDEGFYLLKANCDYLISKLQQM